MAPWVAAARAAAAQAPLRARWPLLVAGQAVGSVEPQVVRQIELQRLLDKRFQLLETEHLGAPACHLDVPLPEASSALNALAEGLRRRGLCGPWRNEQLAVCNPQGEVVGTVERGAVRVLGVATRAVHLVGLAPDGRMWVQKRSMAKPNNPGLWDTLMGGMVSAADSLPQALARETWEEAGLHVASLVALRHGGQVDFSCPSREGNGTGYLRERIDWFQAHVPAGLEPCNQDGEVERFDLLTLESVRQRVAQGLFTREAGLVVAGFLGM